MSYLKGDADYSQDDGITWEIDLMANHEILCVLSKTTLESTALNACNGICVTSSIQENRKLTELKRKL